MDGGEAMDGSFLWRFVGTAGLVMVVLLAGGALSASSADTGEREISEKEVGKSRREWGVT